ncbi:MAG: hypothetical protein FJ304_12655 [Planctomycetes bacterium]|nr:hypothetical protein [Planctomycetota bacterium]
MTQPTTWKTWFAIAVVLVLGTVSVGIGAQQFYKHQTIANGPTFEGRATAWEKARSRGRERYKVAYTFVRDGVTYTGGLVVVPQDVHDATRGGAPLVVRAAGAYPDWHQPDATLTSTRLGSGTMCGTGAILLAMGTFTLLARRRTRARVPVAPSPGSP